MEDGEPVHPGSKVFFSSHSAFVGDCVIWPASADPLDPNSSCFLVDDHNMPPPSISEVGESSNSKGESLPNEIGKNVDGSEEGSFSMYEIIKLGLDFSYGLSFKSKVKERFRSTVHPLGKSDQFLMTVSFGRAKFKLTEDMVGIALESCVGGNCDDFFIVQLSLRVFCFSVASRYVGFMIYALRSFSSD